MINCEDRGTSSVFYPSLLFENLIACCIVLCGGFYDSQDAFVVCRIFQKRGPGPQNGAQYGAPFVEEEWEDDELSVLKEEDGGDALNVLSSSVPAEMDDYEQVCTLFSITFLCLQLSFGEFFLFCLGLRLEMIIFVYLFG